MRDEWSEKNDFEKDNIIRLIVQEELLKRDYKEYLDENRKSRRRLSILCALNIVFSLFPIITAFICLILI